MADMAWLIPILPLVSWLILAIFGRHLPRQGDWLGIISIAAAFVLAVGTALDVGHGGSAAWRFNWALVGDHALQMGFVVDSLAALMLVVVTFVSLMVQLFSIGYMHGDRRYKRYYAVLSFFSFSMLGLVLADNFLGLFIFWELVGLASYLLISHWYEKPEVGQAAMKAFLTTRLGDISLLFGFIMLFGLAAAAGEGTFRFDELAHLAETGSIGGAALTIAAILVFGGAVGKSAQFPLYVWLPDAMAGPTPVSALIHAATMVAAGVYLVARAFGIFLPSPDALLVVAWVGGITALFAALVAVTRDDIKQVLAYSTVSQLGYMMMGLGAGGFTSGMFHLTTHAFFKALLFLAAGSVIHGMHEVQDLRRMGGLARKMPVTAIAWIIGGAALAGIPPFSGFFSKDEILLELYHTHPALFWIGIIGAVLTAFYTTRATWLAFFGKPSEEAEHAHESPLVMLVPLGILAVLAFGAGFFAEGFAEWIHFGEEVHHVESSSFAALAAILAAFGGVVLGVLVYGLKVIPAGLVSAVGPAIASWIDRRIMNGAAHGLAGGTLKFGEASADFDREVVDGAVDGVAEVALATSGALRRAQSGMVQLYALTMFVAVVAGLIIFVIGG